MAALPFKLELQLDATEKGTGDTLGADLTLNHKSISDARSPSTEDSPIAKACKLLETWDMADSRWHRIADASITQIVPIGQEGEKAAFLLMLCTPAFIKAKWVATRPQPAKVYFQCASRLLGSKTSGTHH